MSPTGGFQRRLAATRLATVSRVTELFDGLADYNASDAEPFARRAAGLVVAGQLVTARSTAVYLARRAGVRAVALDRLEVTGEALRGVDPAEVYQRPFGKVWGALNRGRSFPEALGEGRAYLGALAAADLALSMRASATVVAGARRIAGWQRKADFTACDLCSAADGETFASPADMGLHPWCGCTPEPVTGDEEPSAPQPEDDGADQGAVTTHQHGELGAVLAAPGHAFSED